MIDIDNAVTHCQAKYEDLNHDLSIFMDGIRKWFETHPKLSNANERVIHSVKSRMKDPNHLEEKVKRKIFELNEQDIEPEQLFLKITDLAGVRLLLLHQEQLSIIHNEITKKISSQDWFLYENPKAYTWDPESAEFFRKLGIDTHLKDSHYTSVHYVIRPKPESPLACEIQVRTLFEEIWGEVDHTLNYPIQSENIACREQLKVLAKVVGAGSRLVDSIFRTSKT